MVLRKKKPCIRTKIAHTKSRYDMVIVQNLAHTSVILDSRSFTQDFEPKVLRRILPIER